MLSKYEAASFVEQILNTALAGMVSGAQIVFGVIVALVVLATPFARFAFHGYGAFNIAGTDVQLVSAAVILTTLGIAYFAYLYGRRSSQPARYAKLTLYLGLFQWLWILSAYLSVSNEIIYHSTFAVDGYSWWLGGAAYATALGAIIFTVTGLLAVRVTR